MIRRQGVAFCVCASAAALACLILPRLDRATELAVIAAPVLLLGVPHGALDALFARRLCGTRSVAAWAGFGAAYVAAAAAVAAVWIVSPSAFLIGFLIVSAAHFSGDPGPGTRALSRLFYGGAIIVLPALAHGPEVETLFALLAGPRAAALATPVLAASAAPWLAALAVCAAIEARRDLATGLELAAVGALAAAAPPLVAFTVFFCAMHSPRHILRTAAYASDLRPRLLLAAGIGPTVLVIAAAAAVWTWMPDTPPDARIMQILFVGLAALTVPHMALVERVRLSGWAAPAARVRCPPPAPRPAAP